MTAHGRQRGVTYLLMLFAVAALGFGLAHFGGLWATAAQRGREAELLFIGGEFARALASYQAALPDDPAPGPATLDALLIDPRVPFVRRHLRRVYRDPMTGAADWVLERQDGRIVGLRSRSEREVLRSDGLPEWVSSSGVAAAGLRYRDWLFRPTDVMTRGRPLPAPGR
ncbi:type II secretion system protein [Zoogloea sp. LCSB751]|uniref:type II secretion system protein n=1 Tax=Zoogloea sp. LCSB751 TaxID=1965277 RepID=UPI0009A50DC7|nr:type II secretion system protein [Zoogloea sp. LCSB751]